MPAEPVLGAGDSNSGGGNASGTPDGDTAMTAPGSNLGDVERDRKALFPEAKTRRERPPPKEQPSQEAPGGK